MEEKIFSSLVSDARKNLDAPRLMDAVKGLTALAESLGDWTLKTGVQEVSASYELMLHYFRQGVHDGDRSTMYHAFVRKGYELCDQAERLYKLKNSSELYYATARTLQSLNLSLSEVVAKLKENTASIAAKFSGSSGYIPELHSKEKLHAELSRQLFDLTWTSQPWTAAEFDVATELLASPVVRDIDQALFVSAVTLGLLHTFDARKLHFLLDHVTDSRTLMACRESVGFAFAVLKYDRRICIIPDLTDRLKCMADDKRFVSSLCSLQMQLLLSIETKGVERELHEEIIPAMVKSPHFKNSKLFFGEMDDDMLNTNCPNPDWQENEELKRIEGKLQKLSELQAQGVDVYMGTFSTMKQQYPFFSVPANWFLPFYDRHPDLYASGGKVPSFLQTMLNVGVLCDSDRYSFAFMLASLPASQCELINTHLSSMGTNAAELFDMGKQLPQQSEELLRRFYLQDLYRFFQLFVQHEQFDNPFRRNLLLPDCRSLSELFLDNDTLLQLADFAFNRRSYTMALRLFEQLTERGMSSIDVYQKIGFCHQAQGAYTTAIAFYNKADLLDDDNQWTLYHLAQSHHLLGRFSEALTYWRRLEKKQPDDLHVQYRLGECLIQTGRYEEAFGPLFKVDYLEPGKERIQRALAWCSLLADKPQQAERYYEKLLAARPSADDFFNAGHSAWVNGDIAKAIERYARFIQLKGTDVCLSELLEADLEVLAKYSLGHEDLSLMADAVDDEKE